MGLLNGSDICDAYWGSPFPVSVFKKKQPCFYGSGEQYRCLHLFGQHLLLLAMEDTGVPAESVLLAGVHGTVTLQEERRASHQVRFPLQ